MRRALGAILAACLTAALPAAVAAGEKKEARFSRGKLKGPAGETVWYRFKSKESHIRDLVTKVLGRYGLKNGKDFTLHAHDHLGLLAITGSKDNVDLFRSLLEFLEEDQPQIKISVRIVETLSNRDLQTGLEVNLDRKSSKDTFFRGFTIRNQSESYIDSLLTSKIQYAGTSFGFGTVDEVDAEGNFVSKSRERVGSVSMAMRALGEHQVANILAKPELLVVSGTQAKITTLQRIPYQTVQLRGNSANIRIKELPIGISMQIKAYLIGEDSIQMDILTTVNTQAGVVEVGPGIKNPYTSDRRVKTTVTVPSGFEVILGGLFQKESSVVEKGVPLLSDIPILGLLFKSYWKVQKRKELLFFIQPTIVKPSARLFDPLGG